MFAVARLHRGRGTLDSAVPGGKYNPARGHLYDCWARFCVALGVFRGVLPVLLTISRGGTRLALWTILQSYVCPVAQAGVGGGGSDAMYFRLAADLPARTVAETSIGTYLDHFRVLGAVVNEGRHFCLLESPQLR